MRFSQHSLGTPSHVNVGTNTDLELPVADAVNTKIVNSKIVDATNLYPALPRYN